MARPRFRMSAGGVLAALVLVVTAPATPAVASTIGGEALAGKRAVVQALPGADSLPKGVTARGWVLADLDSGNVLAARNAHGTFLPASTIKVLTAISLLPVVPPETMIEATWDDAAVDGSRVGIVEGWSYTADDLYRAMLMVSGNDAALALTRPIGGPQRALELMNAEARRLQALDTNAQSVNGLDEGTKGMTTSAYDLALFGRAGMNNPTFAEYVGTKSADFPAPPEKWKNGQTKRPGKATKFQIYTHVSLLTKYAGALGIKNGWTSAAGYTFIGAAERDGRRLIVATMGGKRFGYLDGTQLLDWGFANADKVTPVGTLVDPVPAADAAPAAEPTAAATPAVAPVADAPAVAAASPASDGGTNGMLALAGGLAGGMVLAVLAGVIAARRRNTLVVDALPTLGAPAVRADNVVVPPQQEPTYTSVRIRRPGD